MYTHLKERKHYEDLLDRWTVESGRRGMKHYDSFYDKFISELKPGEKIDGTGKAFLINTFYMQVVGNELIEDYQKRDSKISEMIARDEALDEKISNARLTEEPTCHHCFEQGLRIIDKSFMHREEDRNFEAPKEVLFMLSCPHCDKNSAFWEDGTAWRVKPTLCPKCSTEVTHTSTKTKNAINLIYTCPSCEHSYKEKLDLTTKKEKPDPDFEKDRAHFCLHDKEFRDHLIKMKEDFEEMARLGKIFKEREDNKHIYDAIKEIKKLKITELSDLIAPSLKKAGYIDFSLDKPNMGREVSVGFNCLDSKSDRDDTNSRKTLKKLIEDLLEETSWRLMSEGIEYRLGYLSGKLRAYEAEEDLKKLAEKSEKLIKKARNKEKVADKDPGKHILDNDGRKIIL